MITSDLAINKSTVVIASPIGKERDACAEENVRVFGDECLCDIADISLIDVLIVSIDGSQNQERQIDHNRSNELVDALGK